LETQRRRNYRSISDELDFIIIFTEKEESKGVFIFPKAVLHQKKIISDENKDGKRGIRVYPPWDLVTSKQGLKTQEWQVKHFINLSDKVQVDLDRAKEIYTRFYN
jgi:hypothetical protein